ncbi:MAG: site-2 protease family protein [Anaerolineaceae bacterium]|nr:MAG: site-2 protease family protein [Anaerolineaceae bacterium]
MFNEPASSFGDAGMIARRGGFSMIEDALDAQDTLYSDIRQAIEDVLTVYDERFAVGNEAEQQRARLVLMSTESHLLVTFSGRLRVDAERAYERLDAVFAEHDLLPIFRENSGGRGAPEIEYAPHMIYVVHGRVQPKQGGTVLSAVLFLLTVLSVTFVGSLMAIGQIGMDDPARATEMMQDPFAHLWRGWPYAFGILTILGAHELGHYFAARYHRTAASLPYFLPFPFGIFGTFGAAIRLREPMRNRKILLDIGAAGPLAGLVFAVPILLIGLATSPVAEMTGAGFVEGNSIIYALSKLIIFGEVLPADGRDVFVNQLAWAGWTGLLVTGLNLIPVGQLDGGHILYALMGRFAKLMYFPIVVGMILLAFFVARELAFFVVLIILLGNMHAVPLNDITPLDARRRGVAVLSLVVFALVFVPNPLSVAESQTILPPDGGRVTYLLPVFFIVLWQAVRRR